MWVNEKVSNEFKVLTSALYSLTERYQIENTNRLIIQSTSFKVACTSAPIFEKNYEAVPHIYYTNNLLSDWSNA